MKFFDIDRFKEILDTLTRNKGRSLLTGFGVFWGIFMLLFLLGGGDGFKVMLNQQMGGFASNSAMIWSQNTSKPYKGFNKGRYWEMNIKDVEILKEKVPEADIVSPQCFSWSRGEATYEDKSSRCNVKGLKADFAKIETPTIVYGRYINEMDVAQKRKVCVIGKQVYENLYPKGVDPCGTRIKIGPAYYQVIGVDYNEHSVISFGGRQTEAIVIPISVVQAVYNMGDKVQVMAVTAKEGIVMSDIIPKIRKAIASNHYIDPTDEQAVTVLNTEIVFHDDRQSVQRRELPDLANWNRDVAGRCDRRLKHYDGDGPGTYHGNRNPPSHWSDSEDDSIADHLGKHPADSRGRNVGPAVLGADPARVGAGLHDRRHPSGSVPDQFLDSCRNSSRVDCSRSRGRTRPGGQGYEHQTGGRYEG